MGNEANGTKYVQFSKIFVGISGVFYLIEVFLIIYLVCSKSYASDALIEILGTTTGLVGIIFGCYTGNSAAEKYIRGKSQYTSNNISSDG